MVIDSIIKVKKKSLEINLIEASCPMFLYENKFSHFDSDCIIH